MTLLVGGVVSNTTGGQKFSEMMESLQTKAATELAQFMLSTKEGTVELNPADKDDDSLIGGGRLITSILTGGLPGRAKRDNHISVGGGSVNDHPRGDKACKGEKEKAEEDKAENGPGGLTPSELDALGAKATLPVATDLGKVRAAEKSWI